jgi:hypothetical protein
MAKPLTKEEFYSRHSAYFQQIGFDEQFAGCMYYLISLGDTDELSYETEDDFVILRTVGGKRIKEYYQVKHTKDANKNMTDSDGDFWKSIDNWLTPFELSSKEEQKTYFTNAKFIVLTNKKPKNFLDSLAKQLQDGLIELPSIKEKLTVKAKGDVSYKDTLSKLLSLDDKYLREFLMKLQIVYFEDFTKDMYEHFVYLNYNPVRSDQIVKQLIGDLFIHKKTCGKDFSFTGQSYRKRCKDILQQISITDDNLSMEGYDQDDVVIPKDFADLMMVKQLVQIDAVDTPLSTEDPSLMDYLTSFYQFQNAFQDFERIQILTATREKMIDQAAYKKWYNLFKTHQDSIIDKDRKGLAQDEDEQKAAGRATLNALMAAPLAVNRLAIDQGFTNGWFLSMSNQEPPRIMWHFQTYKKYSRKK